MKKLILFLAVNYYLFFFGALVTSADIPPSVNNLYISASSINSGQPIGFTWSLSNSSGSSFIIPCQTGIKISYADGSGSLSCGSRYALSNPSNGSASLAINNVTGGLRTITFQVIPKDMSGTDYDSGLVQTQITLYTLSEPITDLTINPTTLTSGSGATLTWAGHVVDGVNISIDCSDGVTVSSPNYTNSLYIPCGISPAFPSDLGVLGSLPLTFNNQSDNTKTITIKLLPVITSGLYDGTHAKIVTIDVKPKTATPLSIDSFSASSTTVLSGSPVKVSWSISNSAGANFYLMCDSGNIMATSSANPNGTLPCNQKYISDTDFGSSGLLTFQFSDIGSTAQPVSLTLVPSPQTCTYDGTKSKTISFLVTKTSISSTQYYGTYPTGSVNQGTTNTAQTSFKKARVLFARGLRVGITGDDVKALQEFFAQDKTIYPEGLTTGYFGSATLRAIQRFQAKYGIATSGTPDTTGYGALGPKTRALINGFK